MKRFSFLTYFSPFEWGLAAFSYAVIITAYLLGGEGGLLSFLASLLGVAALLFIAKGNPVGHLLCIVFGMLYAIVSYGYAYYGEMATYLGMTVPMSAASLITWLRHPFGEGHAEVRVGRLSRRDALLLPLLSLLVTAGMYVPLYYLGTENLLISTVSVTTSFVAVYFTMRRSPFYALGYAVNDIVLIVLWVLASAENLAYLSVVACFFTFLLNDLYGFFNWIRMERRQESIEKRTAL